MILTDVNGEEVELTPVILRSHDGDNGIIHLDQSENLYRLKPIKKPKWSVTVGGITKENLYNVVVELKDSKMWEAEAIKAFIEAGLEYIYEPYDGGLDSKYTPYHPDRLVKLAQEAREANG